MSGPAPHQLRDSYLFRLGADLDATLTRGSDCAG